MGYEQLESTGVLNKFSQLRDICTARRLRLSFLH